jgi:TolA-binding protein
MPKKSFYLNGAAIAEITELEGQLSEANGTISTRDAEITRLTSELETMTNERNEAVTALEKVEPDKEAALKELETVKTELGTTQAALKTSNDKLATFDADVEKAAAARFAGLGGDPLPGSGKDEKGNAEIVGLTGLERATAIHKQQAADKKKK